VFCSPPHALCLPMADELGMRRLEFFIHQINDEMKKPTAIAIFCGAGGLSLGFKRAGFDVLFATDINHHALDSYSRYFPSVNIFEGDIRDFSPSSLPNGVDILLGGPPCQGFSSAGQQFWDDPRNKLLTEYVRILDAIRPKWFLMENVEGLLTTWNGQYICECVKAMLGPVNTA
jgi:DNA (cytosine-5)-methyltransferase 1